MGKIRQELMNVDKEKVLSTAFILAIIVMEILLGGVGIYDVSYLVIGIAGMCIWYFKDNIGLMLIGLTEVISTLQGNTFSLYYLILIIIVLFVRVLSARKVNEDTLSRTTVFKESKWWSRLSVVCLFIICICYGKLNDDSYSLLSYVWAFTPTFVLVGMIMCDAWLTNMFVGILLIVNVYLNYMIYSLDSNWYGIVMMLMIAYMIANAYKRARGIRSLF
jgi:hypothetical protein